MLDVDEHVQFNSSHDKKLKQWDHDTEVDSINEETELPA